MIHPYDLKLHDYDLHTGTVSNRDSQGENSDTQRERRCGWSSGNPCLVPNEMYGEVRQWGSAATLVDVNSLDTMTINVVYEKTVYEDIFIYISCFA